MTPPHNPATGNVVRFDTHRPVAIPDEWAAEHCRVGTQCGPRIFTAAEVRFVFFLGGLFGALITCASAWVIVGMPL